MAGDPAPLYRLNQDVPHNSFSITRTRPPPKKKAGYPHQVQYLDTSMYRSIPGFRQSGRGIYWGGAFCR